MILDTDALKAAIARGETVQYRYFWGHRPRPDGRLSDSCFSQWWKCSFAIDGQRYSSAEQFMMSEKARLFGDEESRQKILATDDPAYAKKLGRGVKNFLEEKWAAARFDLVTRGNVAKFGDDEKLRGYLISTKNDVLVEASPTDTIWGIGLAADNPDARDPATWRGLNLLGFALMRARAILRGEVAEARRSPIF
jgi:ribA/ribD-fused uncharacterized protein